MCAEVGIFLRTEYMGFLYEEMLRSHTVSEFRQSGQFFNITSEATKSEAASDEAVLERDEQVTACAESKAATTMSRASAFAEDN